MRPLRQNPSQEDHPLLTMAALADLSPLPHQSLPHLVHRHDSIMALDQVVAVLPPDLIILAQEGLPSEEEWVVGDPLLPTWLQVVQEVGHE
jgi:hypothetical protein